LYFHIIAILVLIQQIVAKSIRSSPAEQVLTDAKAVAGGAAVPQHQAASMAAQQFRRLD
jgi:hypothetical protein